MQIPDIERFGVAFAFTAAFIALTRSLWTGLGIAPAWIASFATTLASLHFGISAANAIIIGALVGSLLGLVTTQRQGGE